MMTELLDILHEAWDDGRGSGISMYDILDGKLHVRLGKSKWDRMRVISALRYIYLCSRETQIFDEDLFDKLVNDAGAPFEGNGYRRRYDRNDLTLI